MLKEFPNTKQHPGEPKRRWFWSEKFDLYVWQDEAGEIVAFQLCYAKYRGERALFWKSSAGYAHLRIDDGEAGGLGAATPIMLADGLFDAESVLESFLGQASELPEALAGFIAKHIVECPMSLRVDPDAPAGA